MSSTFLALTARNGINVDRTNCLQSVGVVPPWAMAGGCGVVGAIGVAMMWACWRPSARPALPGYD